MLVPYTCAVAICARNFHQMQTHDGTSPMDCPRGICLDAAYLSDLILAVGSLLGLWAMRSLTSLKLLGGPAALLPAAAMEFEAVQKWTGASRWQCLYLAIVWVGSLALRSAALWPDPDWQGLVQACAFALASLVFVGQVFSILHMSCLVSVLIDNYAARVSRDKDLAKGVEEWDKLVALSRRVSRAANWSLPLVQVTLVAVLLCSIGDLMLQGEMSVSQLVSNMLLVQCLPLLASKIAEVTEKCTCLAPLINSFRFHGDGFSLEKHCLVEHVAYSDAGFYIGGVRVTAARVLKIAYASIVATIGILTKLATD